MAFRFHAASVAFAIGVMSASGGLADERPTAAEAGAFASMQEILSKAPGTLLEAELEKKRGVWVYEIKSMGTDGSVTKVIVDAKSGELATQARNKKKGD